MFKLAASLAVIAVALALLSTAAGGADAQNGDPQIRNFSCEFGLNTDADPDSDKAVDPYADGEMWPQDVEVIGQCEFRLRAPDPTRIRIKTDLHDWQARVRDVTNREDVGDGLVGGATNKIETPPIQGDLDIQINIDTGSFRGDRTPIETDNGYRHEVQVPTTFELLIVEAISESGSSAESVPDVPTASQAYIDVHQRLADSRERLNDETAELVERWLDRGYPQVADDILETVPEGSGGGVPQWIGLLIVLAFIVVLAIIVATGIYLFLSRRQDRQDKDDRGRRQKIKSTGF